MGINKVPPHSSPETCYEKPKLRVHAAVSLRKLKAVRKCVVVKLLPPLLLCHHPLNANLGGFSAVVAEIHLFEPVMVESFLGGDSARRVVDEDLPEQVPEILHERVVLGDHILHKSVNVHCRWRR